MTENELFELLQSGENIPLIASHLSMHPEGIETLMSLVLSDGPDTTWRAAWVADKVHEVHPELIAPYLPSMISFALKTADSGKKRHLLKLISLHDIPDDQIALLMNHCGEVFSNAAEPVAVRVHAMQILFNIAQKEPDFKGELIDWIEHELEYHGSAGLTSRGRKLLKKLQES
jgi:hypothetical protein